MKTRVKAVQVAAVLCTGVTVLVVWACLLYVVRSVPEAIMVECFVMEATLHPSGLFPADVEPNRTTSEQRPSALTSSLRMMSLEDKLDVWRNIERRQAQQPQVESWIVTDPNQVRFRCRWAFNRGLGVWTIVRLRRDPDKERSWIKSVELYAGPQGMSPQYSSELGRFSPQGHILSFKRPSEGVIYYDDVLRQVFRLDSSTQTVTPGVLFSDDEHLVQMGSLLQKNGDLIRGPDLRKPYKIIPADNSLSKSSRRELKYF